MKRLFLFSLFLILTESLYSKKTHENEWTETHQAIAYLDREMKKPIYTEKHTAFFKGGKLAYSSNDYFDMKGKKIAELNSNYSKDFMMPTYIFKDLRTQSEEGLRLLNGKYIIFRKEKGSKEEISELKVAKNLFSCQGWHYYLLRNLKNLEQEMIKLKLILPSRLDFYNFRARFIESKGNLIKLKIELDSWFLRLFADSLEITYDRTKKKLVSYSGISNILSDEGKTQTVYISYNPTIKNN